MERRVRKFYLLEEVKKFFYKGGATEIHKEKIISIIVLTTLLIGLVFYGKSRKSNLASERERHKRYTIGFTIKQGKNFRLPNPFVVYYFRFGGRYFEKTEEIPDYLHEKIIVERGRYYVHFSTENPDNCKMLLERPIPDSISEAPDDGWGYMPGY